jgi:hypothetical protein
MRWDGTYRIHPLPYLGMRGNLKESRPGFQSWNLFQILRAAERVSGSSYGGGSRIYLRHAPNKPFPDNHV